ncbi:hypothetical protein PZ61_0235810 [Streptomyces sp. MNU77]|uniref:epoxide hydrolase family protein n=1 Tax=Streptomyces sp. MNU77 TaxID=1573406 RepID=UPI0007C70B67|nr:epoxide hydrolase family protein [Streptomyces sp. MNU77]OLO25802.1 hypothetical protein PZ61_0235810 [Streptomyces sp. MNU77]
MADRFTSATGDEVLEDLRERLRTARIAPDHDNDDWSYGVPGGVLADLVGHWRDGYDWRAAESGMNALPRYRTEIDGVPVHFVHARGEGPRPVPIVLTHGWPGSFWDLRHVIPRLTHPSRYGGDAGTSFDVVVPSLPGFDWSGPLRRGGVNYASTADLWVRLMTEVLGYERFGAHGYDWGGSVTAQLGHRYADRLFAVHLAGALTLGTWSGERPYASVLGTLMAEARGELREALIAWERARVSHLTVHLLEPQTLAYALHDSPVGLLAWLLQRRRHWSDPDIPGNPALDRDDILTLATLNWVTGAVGSSIRYYQEASRHHWIPAHARTPVVEAPTGISLFRPDLPPGFDLSRLAGHYRLVHTQEHRRGGHFPALEVPDALVADIRATFAAAGAFDVGVRPPDRSRTNGVLDAGSIYTRNTGT